MNATTVPPTPATGQVHVTVIPPAPLAYIAITTTQARRTNRTVLEKIIARGAACSGAAEEFYRVEGERLRNWKLRRERLIQEFCLACPVREACEETALRSGEGEERGDSIVRGGLFSEDLNAARKRHRTRLLRAIAADAASNR